MHVLRQGLAVLAAAIAGQLLARTNGLSAAEIADRSTRSAANATARETIRATDLKRVAEALSDDSLEGREAGSRGGQAAGLYLAREFERLKLEPAGTNRTYFQAFNGNCRNVLGLIKGSEPPENEQYIVVCAHYDHVGYGTRRNSNGPTGYIHNGADDNASGAAAVVDVAEAIRALPEPPQRSILFALWDSEENGLYGSKHWIHEPTIPADRVAAAINLDMVGRLRQDKLIVYGTRTRPGFRRLFSEANRGPELLLDFSWEMNEDSDHYNFFSAGIPVIMLHTGLHSDYHRPSDDASKLNSEGMERIGKLLFNAIAALADEPRQLRFRPQSRLETSSRSDESEQALAPLPGRLGVRWATETLSTQSGVLLSEVTASSAAHRAGLRKGDRIMRFAGQVADPQRLPQLVLAAPNDVEAEILRPGIEEPFQVKIQLSGQPIRLGIAWRFDDAEPEVAQITRVVPGSPAAASGLRVLERVYEVNDQRFRSSDELRKLLAADGPLRLLVETRGRMRTIELMPLVLATPTGP